MAVTQNTYTGNGSTTNYSFTFPYLEETDIKVTLNGTLTTAYTLANATTISFTTAPGAGVAIRIYRDTDTDNLQSTFFAGSAIRAQDLNDNFNQVLYSTQETVARRVDSTGGSMTGNLEFSAGKGIVFEGTTDDANETTLLGGDPTADRTLNLPNVSGTLVSTGDTGTVATAMIADSNVTTAKIADSNVTTPKIADGNVTTDKLANSSVTSAKIADGTIVAGDLAADSVITSKILDSNVTTAKIADSNVTTAKLADGAVTSAKIADGTIVAGDIATDAVITSKILDQNVTTAKIADQNVTTAKIADLNVTTGKINDQAVTAAKIADGVIDSTKLTGATVVTNAEHTGSTPNDTSFFTTSASDSRYFRQDSSETITSGNPWSSSDTYVATTAAIDARVIDLVDDVGGFVPITNETSFPLTNPDINNPDGSGTIISIKEIVTTRTPASGTVTIANGAGSNTVTINGCGSTVLASGFGVLVETTSTLHTYNFHRLVPKATEVTTVAGISGDITTVATNNANVTAVAGNAANINTVAGNNANVTAVATNSTNINAVAGNATNINAVAGNAANINTVSTNIANVNNVGGSIANVNSVASNLGTVNDFAARYRVASSDPVTSLDTGDLVFNTTNNELRVYNGTAWQGGVTATGNLVSKSGDTMTGPLGITAGTAALPSLFISGDPNTGIYSPGADQVAISTNGTGRLFINSSGQVGVGTNSPQQKLAVVSSGVGYEIDQSSLANTNLLLSYDRAASAYRAVANYYGGTYSWNDSGIERMRIDSSGRVGIGTSSPSVSLDCTGAISAQGGNAPTGGFQLPDTSGTKQPRLTNDAGNATVIRAGSATGGVKFNNFANSSELVTIDNSGRLLVGTSSARTASGLSAYFQLEGTTAEAGSASIIRNGGNPYFGLFRTGSASLGSVAAVGANAGLAEIDFGASDGTTVATGAYILAVNDSGSAWTTSSHPTRLAIFTTADGASSPTERMRIDSSGRVGVGTASPSYALDVKQSSTGNSNTVAAKGGTNGGGYFWETNAGTTYGAIGYGDLISANSGSSNTAITSWGAQDLLLGTNRTERARIDTSGRLLVGTSSSVQVYQGATTFNSELQVAGSSASLTIARSIGSGNLFLARNQTVIDGSTLGVISFNGGDGTNIRQAAEISAVVDGTPGTGDMPGRIVLSTTADGASSPTERLRIANNGAWGLAGANYGTSGQVLTSQGSGSAPQWATPSGGKILQVVSSNYRDITSFSISNNTRYVWTGLGVTITPTSTSSKIIISLQLMGGWSAANAQHESTVTLSRRVGGTDYIFGTDDSPPGTPGNRNVGISTSQVCVSNDNNQGPHSYIINGWYDQPATTSAITYYPALKFSVGSTQTYYVNRSYVDSNDSDHERCYSWITAMEVQG